jgi:hypothetical protein
LSRKGIINEVKSSGQRIQRTHIQWAEPVEMAGEQRNSAAAVDAAVDAAVAVAVAVAAAAAVVVVAAPVAVAYAKVVVVAVTNLLVEPVEPVVDAKASVADSGMLPAGPLAPLVVGKG